MKTTTIAGSALLFCALVSSVQAQVKATGATAIPTSIDATVFVRPFCEFGLQFVATTVDKKSTSNGAGGVAVVQVLGKDGKPLPCEKDSK